MELPAQRIHSLKLTENKYCQNLVYNTDLIEDLPRRQTLPFTEGELEQVEADCIPLTVWELEGVGEK